jgi:hypothetical protein
MWRSLLSALGLAVAILAPSVAMAIDVADYWPNTTQVTTGGGYYLKPESYCFNPVPGNHAEENAWHFTPRGTITASGGTFRTTRILDPSTSVAIQDWAYESDYAYNAGEIVCTTTQCDGTWLAPFGRLWPRTVPGSPYDSGSMYFIATQLVDWDTTYASPQPTPSTATSRLKVTSQATNTGDCHGGTVATAKVEFLNPGTGAVLGYEQAWISDKVPICGTETWKKGLAHWQAGSFLMTQQQCTDASGDWYSQYGLCVVADVTYCWEPE